jgi:hypothetical protein
MMAAKTMQATKITGKNGLERSVTFGTLPDVCQVQKVEG